MFDRLYENSMNSSAKMKSTKTFHADITLASIWIHKIQKQKYTLVSNEIECEMVKNIILLL